MQVIANQVEPSGTISDVARRPLRPEECALLVIDIQEKLLPPIFNKDALVRNAQLLIRLANILRLPTLVSTQYTRGLGSTVPEISSLLSHPHPIDKLEFSCFSNDQFCGSMKSVPGNRNTLLLCGMETHICVMQTALGALNRGFLVHVASDAVGSRTEANWNVGLKRMEAAGSLISSTETIIYELLRASGTPAFKAMLPHLKG
jgi:nicotinamidase-related amidase